MKLETFYQSKRWLKLVAQLKLERVNDDGQLICEECGEPISKAYDCIAHHTIELTEDNVNDYSISLNPENIRLIHFRCHNRLHHRFNGFRQTVYLVYGSPCAGKSTWVQDNAYDDDLILDLDRIWESICLCDRLHKPSRLKANVFGIRDAIIEQIKLRKGKWRNAFVIGTYPLATDRDRLCQMLRAKPIFVDATKEECLARAETEEWKLYVEEWFDTYTPADSDDAARG